MNPKQLACVLLMMVIGVITYFGQIVHKKVAAMKLSASQAQADAAMAESARQTAEIMTARTKSETEELRRFLKAWTPFIDKAQTEQEIDSAIELSLRERGISLVRSRKTEVKNYRENRVIPKAVMTTLIVEDEYAKVMNWWGDIEKRLPLARANSLRVTGGGSTRQIRLDISLETPLINLTDAIDLKAKKKS